MAEWILVLMFIGKTPAPGDIHATGMKMTREECVDMIKDDNHYRWPNRTVRKVS